MARESYAELIKRLNSYADEAKQAVETRHNDWTKWWDWYMGDHLKHIGVPLEDWQKQDWANSNLLFNLVEQEVALLNDAMPTWYVVAEDGRYEEQARQIGSFLQGIWHGRRVSTELHYALKDMLIGGTGAVKAWWDADLGETDWEENDAGKWEQVRLGDVNVEWLDPFSLLPDPSARRLKEAEWLIIANDLTRDGAARRFPKFDPDAYDKPETVSPSEPGIGSRPNFFQRAWQYLNKDQGMKEGPNRLYRVYEAYHEAGDRMTFWSGKQMLWDGRNPVPQGPYREHRYPVHIFAAHPTGQSLFGQGIIQQLEMLQRLLDVTLMRVAWQDRFVGNPVNYTDSVIPAGGLKPGAVIKPRPNGQFTPIRPPEINQSKFLLLEHIKSVIEQVSGLHEAAQGQRPPSLQSGIAIQHLQEASQNRIRELSRLSNEVIEELGQSVLNIMAAGYEEKRTAAYMAGSSPATAQVGPETFREGEEKIPFRCVVQTGGDLPLNPMAQGQLALQVIPVMAKLDAVHAAALAEAVNLPDRARLLEQRADWQEFMAFKQMQAQAQAQAAGQQQGMPSGPLGMPSGPQEMPSGPQGMV